MNVTLPWPPSALSPNARVHWASLAKTKAAYRQACWALAHQAKGLQQWAPIDPAARPLVKLTFVPPNRRARDLDNCLAAMKSGLDGLAQALGCDDSRWRLQIEMAEEIGGMVKVEVLT